MGHHHRTNRRQARDERGASLVEYALLIALIAVVVFGSVSFFGAQSEAGYGQSTNCIELAYSGQPIPPECSD